MKFRILLAAAVMVAALFGLAPAASAAPTLIPVGPAPTGGLHSQCNPGGVLRCIVRPVVCRHHGHLCHRGELMKFHQCRPMSQTPTPPIAGYLLDDLRTRAGVFYMSIRLWNVTADQEDTRGGPIHVVAWCRA